MVAGFVALGVLADAAGDVGLRAARVALVGGEHLVQAGLQGLRAAQRVHQPRDVLRHEQAVLPGVGLGVVVVHLARVEGAQPAAVEPGAHEARGRVEDVAPVLRGSHVPLIDVRPAEVFRHLGHAPVVVGVLERLGHALVFVVREHQAVGTEAVQPELGPHGRGQEGLQRLLDVEVGVAAGDGVGDDRRGVVADHAVGFIAPELPDGQLAGLVIDGQEGFDEVVAALRLEFPQQRVLAAEGVPQGEHGVALPAVGAVHAAVHAAVFAVGVGVQRGVDAGVVEGGVEAAQVLFVAPGARQFAQIRLPGGLGGRSLGLEARRVLRQEVLPGVLLADGGDGHAHGHGAFAARESEYRAPPAVLQPRFRRGGEFDEEVDVLPARPAAGLAPAAYGPSVRGDAPAVQRVAVPQVQGDLRPFPRGEAVFVHPHAPAGGQAGEHPGTVQEHLVVTRGGLFPRVREGGRLRAGHQQDVAEVVAAGAGQVRVREAVDDAVAVVVAAAAVPVACLGAGVRAQLHHPEGRDGAGEGVAVFVGAGEGVDVPGEIPAGNDGEQQGEQEGMHMRRVGVNLHKDRK